jgi:putative phosphoesterase
MLHKAEATQVGLISDTHGLLRPEAVAALDGSHFIIHGGDIGDSSILDRLCRIAPLTAVRGNNDHGAWASRIPHTALLEVGPVRIHVVHDVVELGLDPVAGGFQVVVSGHSHKPDIDWRGNVLFINPGSAGPRRFRLPISVAMLTISGASVAPRLIELQMKSAA